MNQYSDAPILILENFYKCSKRNASLINYCSFENLIDLNWFKSLAQ